MKINVLNWILLLILNSTMLSCGIGNQMPKMGEEIVELENTNWTLIKPKDMEATLTINQNASNMRGYNGCNTYEASITVKNYRIEIGSFMMTERFCDDIDNQDEAYMHQLAKVTDYKVVGKKLYLNRGAQSLLIFEPLEQES